MRLSRWRATCCILVVVLVLAVCILPVRAQSDPDLLTDRAEPRAELGLAGLSQLLVELETGQILYSVNPGLEMPPASLAKIMSLYIMWDQIERGLLALDDQVTVSINAWTQRVGGSSMFLEPGDTLGLDMLIRGITVASGNDASVALAEHIARSEDAFVAMMNRQAEELGMSSTRFVSASGLPRGGEEGVSTAGDMATLAIAYLRRFPESLEYHSQRWLTWKIHQHRNFNGLLWDAQLPVNGLKTGFTTAAGHHLIATAEMEGMFLIAVVMGGASTEARETTAAALLQHGARNFRIVRDNWGRRIPEAARVWQGTASEVALRVRQQDQAIVAPRGIPVDSRVELEGPIRAPVREGEKLGQLVLLAPGAAGAPDRQLARLDILAAENVRRGGLFRVIIDAIRLLFNQRLGRPV